MAILKDSGERREFGSGAVRDMSVEACIRPQICRDGLFSMRKHAQWVGRITKLLPLLRTSN